MEKEVIRFKLLGFPSVEWHWHRGALLKGEIAFTDCFDKFEDIDAFLEKRDDGKYYPKDGKYDIIIVQSFDTTTKRDE